MTSRHASLSAVRIDPHRGVTGPAGFVAAATAAGIKPAGDLDLALVVNTGPRDDAAGVFTTGEDPAAPVLWTRQVVSHRRLRAVVLNSGVANAGTGPAGFQDVHATAERAARALGCGAVDVAVCSTGVAGQRLPMAAVLSGVDTLAGGLSSGAATDHAVATAALTTDARRKQAWAGHPGGWSVGGFVKGTGVLGPRLATTIAVLTTDAVVTGDAVHEALRAVTATSFDRLAVDGAPATNDTVLLMSSGGSSVEPDLADFLRVVGAVGDDLVRQVVVDTALPRDETGDES